MMVFVALAAVGLAVLTAAYLAHQERVRVRARIAARQRLLRAIGDGNNAVAGRPAERGYRRPFTKDEIQEAEAELARAEELIRGSSTRPTPAPAP
jgi:hypothetical protein